jgi:endonuclease/exonuclease/phosphatase family metal-dependent hydrolase
MRKLLPGFFRVVTFFSALCYFVSCLTPYISPVLFWPMGFLALGFPYLALLVILLIFAWMFIKKNVAAYLLLLFFAGFQNLYATFAINVPASLNFKVKETRSLRFLSWNVSGFENPSISNDTPGSIRRKMFEYIKTSKADVLCLQEYSNFIGPAFRSNGEELHKLGYIYSYQPNEIQKTLPGGCMFSGPAIFSKVPIIDSGKVLLGDPSYPEHVAYADVMLQHKSIRVFSAHFKSLNLFVVGKDPEAIVPFHSDSLFIYEATRFEKLKVFAQDHSRQALIVKKELDRSPHPLVYTADMNSVPASYPYHTVSKGLQDVFIKKGFGLGTTLDSLPKTLRIDFMFVDKRIAVKKYRKDPLPLSDHFPQVADVQWKH